jgi:hypothetical protein
MATAASSSSAGSPQLARTSTQAATVLALTVLAMVLSTANRALPLTSAPLPLSVSALVATKACFSTSS